MQDIRHNLITMKKKETKRYIYGLY